MNARELAEAKDGILYERARGNVSYSVGLCTDGIKHLFRDKKVLCGMNVKRTKRVFLDADTCKACLVKLDELILEQMKVESRNYWLRPSHKANMSLPEALKPKKEKKAKYVKEMLPEELLPVGSGAILGVSHDNQESQG